jgi:hypothetical protein
MAQPNGITATITGTSGAAMAYVVYTFTQGGQPRRLLYERVVHALYAVVLDLHEHRAEPVTITWGTRLLYDCPAIGRLWEACRAELDADLWHVPAALEPARRRELRPRAAP